MLLKLAPSVTAVSSLGRAPQRKAKMIVRCQASGGDDDFIEEHKSNMRELRKILLEKRKELERKRVAQFHQLRDSLKRNTANVGDMATNVHESVVTFAQSEMEFIKTVFPNSCGTSSESDMESTAEDMAQVEAEVVDPMDAKMDPSYEPPKN